MKAVILAGGKGTRLQPYTTIFPKPLMPVGDKPILEIVIKQLALNGFNEIYLAVGHLAELIRAFFGNGTKLGVTIKYSREDRPLGTAGAIASLKDELDETFLVMNGDVLSNISYLDLFEYHREKGAIATVALKKREVYIDFGVVNLGENNVIEEYTEKPTINYLVSMGINVFEPEVLDYIKPDERFEFPDLIKKLISEGGGVNGYLFDDYWLDIGRHEDYAEANRNAKKIYELLNLKL